MNIRPIRNSLAAALAAVSILAMGAASAAVPAGEKNPPAESQAPVTDSWITT